MVNTRFHGEGRLDSVSMGPNTSVLLTVSPFTTLVDGATQQTNQIRVPLAMAMGWLLEQLYTPNDVRVG